MIIDKFWIGIDEFFNNGSTLFLAFVFGMLAQRILEELGRKNIYLFKLNPKKPYNDLARIINFIFRLILSFVLGMIFIIILVWIMVLFSALIGFIGNIL